MSNIYVGTFNIRTLRTAERELELDNALKEVKFSIIGLSETRIMGTNIVEKANGNVLHYIGETKGQKGVGFLIHKDLKHCIEEYIGINERLAALRLKIGSTDTTIIQVYAPTAGSAEEEINKFYSELDKVMTEYKAPRLYVMGDFNSKIGTKNDGENAMGPYGTGSRNERGEKLIQFAEEHNLRILNTFYKKPNTSKWTWRSPDGKTKNEIDFILSNSREGVRNVQVLNGLKFDSDHRMVMATIRSKGKKKRGKKYFKPNAKKINKEIYKRSLEEKMQQIKETNPNEDVQGHYNSIQSCILQAAMEASKQDPDVKNKEKLSINTLRLIEQREIMKQKWQKLIVGPEEYYRIDKETKREIRKDLREYNLNQIKNVLTNTKSIKRAKQKIENGKYWMLGAQDITGKTKRTRSGIIEAATTFYKNLYDSKSPITDQTIQKVGGKEEEIPYILESEVENAISYLRNNKTPGEDGIINECLKWGNEELLKNITALYNTIVTSERIPQQWNTSTIILLHKKGNRDDLNNYRPISLLSNLYKVFMKILTNRLTRELDDNQPTEQAGFRKNYSTIDHLQAINQIIEKTQEYNLTLYMAFIDYAKAFDTVEHVSILKALEEMKIHPKYIRLIGKIYSNSESKVKIEAEGKTFKTKRGVRQGDPISPKLFTCVLEIVFRRLNWEQRRKGININGRRMSNLRFADDIVLFATTAQQLKEMMSELDAKSKEVGLQMNPAKTRIMTNYKEVQVKIENTPIQYCNKYIYLGQTISLKEKRETELQRRISLAWGKFWSLKFILLEEKISSRLRLETLQTCIIPVLLYGSQTWTNTKKQSRMIQVCQRKMERRILDIRPKDKIRNEELRRRSGLEDAAIRAKKLKWSWSGHVARMSQNRWAYATTMWDPRKGKRRRGRPRQRWHQEFSEVSEMMGEHWTRVARDRAEWKEVIRKLIIDGI